MSCLQPATSKAPSYHHFVFPQVTDAQKILQCSPCLSCLCPRWFLFLTRSVESPRRFLFLGRFLVWGQLLFLGQGFTSSTPPSGDKGVWMRTAAKSRWRQGDGVQHVQRSAEHKGATRNAPRHDLGLEARGTETGRQATREPKGRATPCRGKEDEWKSKKPDGNESLNPSTRLS